MHIKIKSKHIITAFVIQCYNYGYRILSCLFFGDGIKTLDAEFLQSLDARNSHKLSAFIIINMHNSKQKKIFKNMFKSSSYLISAKNCYFRAMNIMNS